MRRCWARSVLRGGQRRVRIWSLGGCGLCWMRGWGSGLRVRWGMFGGRMDRIQSRGRDYKWASAFAWLYYEVICRLFSCSAGGIALLHWIESRDLFVWSIRPGYILVPSGWLHSLVEGSNKSDSTLQSSLHQASRSLLARGLILNDSLVTNTLENIQCANSVPIWIIYDSSVRTQRIAWIRKILCMQHITLRLLGQFCASLVPHWDVLSRNPSTSYNIICSIGTRGVRIYMWTTTFYIMTYI